MISGLVTLIVWLLVVGVLIALVYYVADAIPLPQPLNKIVKIVVMVLACIVVLVLLLNLIGVSTGVDVPQLG